MSRFNCLILEKCPLLTGIERRSDIHWHFEFCSKYVCDRFHSQNSPIINDANKLWLRGHVDLLINRVCCVVSIGI